MASAAHPLYSEAVTEPRDTLHHTPHYGKQMRVHDSALVGDERCCTTNAKKEEIFSDMS